MSRAVRAAAELSLAAARGANSTDDRRSMAALVGDDILAPRWTSTPARALRLPAGRRSTIGCGRRAVSRADVRVQGRRRARDGAPDGAHFTKATPPLTVLVATSGDTGGAVAQAFHGVPGTRVVVLFPDGQVTPCRKRSSRRSAATSPPSRWRHVRRLPAPREGGVRRRRAARAAARLTSANSINLGRLLPQVFYYAHGRHVKRRAGSLVFSVPSGNFGNLAAGLMAWKMGAPIGGFVAATTINDTVPRYLAPAATSRGRRCRRWPTRWMSAIRATSSGCGGCSTTTSSACARVMRRRFTPTEVRDAIREHGIATATCADPHTAIAYRGDETPPDESRRRSSWPRRIRPSSARSSSRSSANPCRCRALGGVREAAWSRRSSDSAALPASVGSVEAHPRGSRRLRARLLRSDLRARQREVVIRRKPAVTFGSPSFGRGLTPSTRRSARRRARSRTGGTVPDETRTRCDEQAVHRPVSRIVAVGAAGPLILARQPFPRVWMPPVVGDPDDR